MANHYSAVKRARQNEKRRAVNRRNLTRVRHQIRALRRALQANDKEAANSLFRATLRQIDKAAQKGVLAKNTSARYKSRLWQRLHALNASSPTPAAP
jgi:small subunit ribosomal protein S20